MHEAVASGEFGAQGADWEVEMTIALTAVFGDMALACAERQVSAADQDDATPRIWSRIADRLRRQAAPLA
jgi:hypothetical protein